MGKKRFNKLKEPFQFWIDRLANAGSHSSDSQELRLRKAILILLTTSYAVFGTLWGVAYLVLGLYWPAVIPFCYTVMTGISLRYFFRTRRYRIFRFSQLTLILILPFLLQWSLGGFAPSGGVMIWSILSPIGALMFAGTNQAVLWFFAYLIIITISGIIEGKGLLSPTPLPVINVISFVMNTGGVSVIVFFLLRHYVSERERAMTALDRAHQQVRQSLSLAMEVQQRLLPKDEPNVKGLDIAGKSIYCDETGGDYYDFLKPDPPKEGIIRIVVGDVSDHGIPSALLMATGRAIIRQRTCLSGSLSEIVTDVNHQLAVDMGGSGRFMSLFYMMIDSRAKHIHWLNAGHEPTVIYDPHLDSFEELSGQGSLPLGVFKDAEYSEAHRDIRPGQIIVLATDGIMEARNPKGEMFGRKRLYDLIRQNASLTSHQILKSMINYLRRFQKGVGPEDDMTLVIVKIEEDL